MKRRRIGLLLAAAVCLLACRPASVALPASGAPVKRVLWIDLDEKTLRVYEKDRVTARYAIASGAPDTPSPVGVFRVNTRFSTEMSGFGTRFLGLSVPWGSYGIHGTNKPSSIGKNASHGCIRLSVRDAEALYRMVPYGTAVVVQGGPYGPLNWGLRTLREGDRGADVRELQLRLIQRRLLLGSADGVFGASTRRAVIAARKAFSLPPGDQADPLLQTKLGMILFE
ncbi:MAG: L,D-transpeptidase [Clostridia bacterium]|nr:L,D-transpeptidase [Clostridia bacterium]